MKNGLKILNRYKFTLIYSVIFWLLGGFVLAVPFAIGGLVVDWLIMRSRQTREPFKNTGYCIVTSIFMVIVYQTTILWGLDQQIKGGIIFDWLVWTEPFTNQMSKYIPIINSYGTQIGARGYEIFSWQVKHLLTIYWFLNILYIPLIIEDCIQYAALLKKNNYFIKADISTAPKNIRYLLHLLSRDVEPDTFIRNINRANTIQFAVVSLFFLIFIYVAHLAFWGYAQLEVSNYRLALLFPALVAGSLVVLPMGPFNIFTIKKHTQSFKNEI